MNLIFFGLRVFLFAFFLALSVGKSPAHQALVVVPAVIYLLLGMYVFLYPGRLRIFKRYGDVFFVSLLAFLSGQKEALFAFLAPMALYSSREVSKGMLILWLAVAFGFYYYGMWGLVLMPAIFASFLASLHPDLVEALRKERHYIRNLRLSYSKLTQEYARLEKLLKSASTDSALLEELSRSHSILEYLSNIKERFGLKAISVVPVKGKLPEEPDIDVEGCSVHVPVRLERGQAVVSFYLDNPMRLYDKELIATLEKAGKLINLYIEGFEEKTEAKVIAV